jgi:hypothetical protein
MGTLVRDILKKSDINLDGLELYDNWFDLIREVAQRVYGKQ